jgi:hypothetical protein
VTVCDTVHWNSYSVSLLLVSTARLPNNAHPHIDPWIAGGLYSVTAPVAAHLGARGRLEELGGVGVAELPIAADVSHVVAAELVDERGIDDEVGFQVDAQGWRYLFSTTFCNSHG